METKEAIKAFIEWAEENCPDAWWMYENPDEAVDKFISTLPSPPSPQEKQGVEEVATKFKNKMADTYSKFGDKKALVMRGRTLTGKEAEAEIRAETEVGISLCNLMLSLAMDLVARDKINLPPAPAAPDKGWRKPFTSEVPGFEGTLKAVNDLWPTPSVEKSEGEEAALESEPVVVERFADNGEHSHWDLVDRDTGQTIWSEDPDFPRKLLKYASDRNNSSGDMGRKEWPSEEEIIDGFKSQYYKVYFGSEALYELSKMDFVRGANWAFNEVRQMNQGQKSKS